MPLRGALRNAWLSAGGAALADPQAHTVLCNVRAWGHAGPLSTVREEATVRGAAAAAGCMSGDLRPAAADDPCCTCRVVSPKLALGESLMICCLFWEDVADRQADQSCPVLVDDLIKWRSCSTA